jgi:hypothetical protein
LTQNLSAAQIAPAGLSKVDRRAIEQMASMVKDGYTNSFQTAFRNLSGPRELQASQEMRGNQRIVRLTWQSAYANVDPIAGYEIWRGATSAGKVAHQTQTTKAPFVFEEAVSDRAAHRYRVIVVDTAGQKVPSNDLWVPAMA